MNIFVEKIRAIIRILKHKDFVLLTRSMKEGYQTIHVAAHVSSSPEVSYHYAIETHKTFKELIQGSSEGLMEQNKVEKGIVSGKITSLSQLIDVPPKMAKKQVQRKKPGVQRSKIPQQAGSSVRDGTRQESRERRASKVGPTGKNKS